MPKSEHTIVRFPDIRFFGRLVHFFASLGRFIYTVEGRNPNVFGSRTFNFFFLMLAPRRGAFLVYYFSLYIRAHYDNIFLLVFPPEIEASNDLLHLMMYVFNLRSVETQSFFFNLRSFELFINSFSKAT